MLSRNTEPHQKCTSNTPPTSGPIAVPVIKLVIQAEIATVRCCASRNMLRINERVDGISVAPAMPSSARAAISISGVEENAANPEARAKAAAPTSNSRRRPIRSPSVPIVSRNPGDQEPVDVDDPQQLGAAGLEIDTQLRHRQVQHGDIKTDEHRG
jgi:hypothetical protein